MAAIDMIVDMGFTEAEARRALQQANSNVEHAVEMLLTGTVQPDRVDDGTRAEVVEDGAPHDGSLEPNLPLPSLQHALPPSAGPDDDPGLSAALEISMRDQPDNFVDAGPHAGESREANMPCGLRNVGNTCYVNSFLQTLLHIEDFGERILMYQPPAAAEDQAEPDAERSRQDSKAEESKAADADRHLDPPARARRREHSIRLASELRQLFAYGLLTQRRCLDPSRLLSEVVDERGEKLPIGSQEDAGEFMLKFLDRLDEGLRAGHLSDAPSTSADAEAKATAPVAANPGDQLVEGGKDEGTVMEKGPAGEEAEKLSALQALFFGRQVQVFSYRDQSSAASDAAQPPTESSPTWTGPAATGDASALSAAATSDKGTAAPGSAGVDKEEVAEPALKAPEAPGVAPEAAESGAAGAEPVPAAAPEAEPDAEPAKSAAESEPKAAAAEVGAAEAAPAAAAAAEAKSDAKPAAKAEPEALPKPDASGLVSSRERSDFLQIFLDVKHKDLYRAWESASSTEVDYTAPSGTSTKANTVTWVERLPKVLFFQLQRVVFNQETKAQVKLDEVFHFDPTIHVDRFLLANQVAATEVSVQVRELRIRREALSEALARFEEYQGQGGLGVERVLGWAADCLDENAKSVPAGKEGEPQLELCDPHNIFAGRTGETSIDEELKASASSAVQLLRNMRDVCSRQEDALRKDLARLAQEAQDAYKDLRQHPYELHAIWLHQGHAGSGHYWACARDWRNDRWLRYDDAAVTVIPWEEVRQAALGQAGSNTSAYVLVYVERAVAESQRNPKHDEEAATTLPAELAEEIRKDNDRLKEEQRQREDRAADQTLRQHAEAVFQHYAVLIHQWEPSKRTADSAGNPHDNLSKKRLYDPALLKFELFLYRSKGEQEVWTYLLMQSIDTQRQGRTWRLDDEPRIMFFLQDILRNQNCYASMLVSATGTGGRRCELVPLEVPKLQAQYAVVLTQAHIVDEALQTLRDDNSSLLTALGMLALVWARWNLEAEDKFRQNEVLLVMSTLIYNFVQLLERHKRFLPEDQTVFFQACDYFVLLVHAVEWPNHWKHPLISKIYDFFPQLTNRAGPGRDAVLKETILSHPITAARAGTEFELVRPEPGEEFFQRHRSLYSWVMHNDEAIVREYMCCHAPGLREQLAGT